MILKLQAKSPSVNVNFKIYEVQTSNKNFLNELAKEVKSNPRQAKRLYKLLVTTHLAFVSVLAQPLIAMAAPINSGNVDPDIVEILIKLEATCVVLAVGAAIVALMLAGMWRMFFGGSQATEWTQNIIKGFGQVITAPMIIALIIGLMTLMFTGMPAFRVIKDALEVWFTF